MKTGFHRASLISAIGLLLILCPLITSAEFPSELELSALTGADGFVLNGSAEPVGAYGEMAGGSVASAGDFNGDGIDDMIIGARFYNDMTGRAYILYGRENWSSSVNLAELDGTNGFIIDGLPTYNFSLFGESVASAGDFNADGLDDIIIGARGVEYATGAAYIIFGTTDEIPSPFDLNTLNGSNGLVIKGVTGGDETGYSVDGIDDFNGDGIDDVIVGAMSADVEIGNDDNRGKTFVLFGKAGGYSSPLELSTMTADRGLVYFGAADRDQAGWSVAGSGDVNGDGLADIVIGAPHIAPDNVNYGQVYVVFGTTVQSAVPVPLASLDGASGFKVDSGLSESAYFGTSVAGAGDINADGFADVIIGAYFAFDQAGRAYVIYGAEAGFPPAIIAEALNGQEGFKLVCSEGGYCGLSVAGIGDLNGDSYADVAVGAPNKSPGSLLSGQTFVVYGRPLAFPAELHLEDLDGNAGFKINGVAEFDASGTSVASAGDVNNDHVDDLIIGAPYAWTTESEPGKAYVVMGQRSFKPIEIDIAPGTEVNKISLNSNGSIPVAILGADDLDVSEIDPASITLEGSRVKKTGKAGRYLCRVDDVDQDGRVDLFCKIAIDDQFQLQVGDTSAELTALTYAGELLKGSDLVRVVSHR